MARSVLSSCAFNRSQPRLTRDSAGSG